MVLVIRTWSLCVRNAALSCFVYLLVSMKSRTEWLVVGRYLDGKWGNNINKTFLLIESIHWIAIYKDNFFIFFIKAIFSFMNEEPLIENVAFVFSIPWKHFEFHTLSLNDVCSISISLDGVWNQKNIFST